MPVDIVNAYPAASLHYRFLLAVFAEYERPVDVSKPLDAVLVFNDPRDMANDVQIVMDVLNSAAGMINTRRAVPEDAPEVLAVPIVFSNNDFVWANEYGIPRLGQGAFLMVVEQLYVEMNALLASETLQSTIWGKP
ncbi:hypothetical protein METBISCDRAFT_24008 [Metschnikowia bicuspidata]|uniref:Uncharacterized protein n=1 Tax=Metschnikowia bicuspidata TaxID=27322 RepID=A0A4P9ZAN1_9ASCO|nr:hypothetical protein METBISCDRAFT_24008 [Metschnikowia bicuspidata]